MANILDNNEGCPFTQITMANTLLTIKTDIENAILIGGTSAKNALIRTQKPIKLIHNALKTEINSRGIHQSLINPNSVYLKRIVNPKSRIFQKTVKLIDKELELSGYFMKKFQDISIIPNNIPIASEVLNCPTALFGENDIYGSAFTESVLSLNVRSQLSSTNKNKGTLYERAIAEAFNFHKRLNKMVLTELYMIIVKEYDESQAKLNTVGFKHADNMENYIKRFQAINLRNDDNDELFKYERCCLLIVDFDRPIPKIYNTVAELKQDGFIAPNSTASLNGLDYTNFVSDILAIYSTRFPANTFN